VEEAHLTHAAALHALLPDGRVSAPTDDDRDEPATSDAAPLATLYRSDT
jgi:hypothetical protein